MSYITRGELRKHKRELIGTELNIHFITAPRENISRDFFFLFAPRKLYFYLKHKSKVTTGAYKLKPNLTHVFGS